MSFPAPSMLVPHRDQALLLESIDDARADGLVASLILRDTMPAWMGPEIMAQAVSAFATWREGRPYRPKPGLLLGVRRYLSQSARFEAGAHLVVGVRESTRDDAGRAVFDSTISADGTPVAQGMLTVFQPEDLLDTLAGQLE